MPTLGNSDERVEINLDRFDLPPVTHFGMAKPTKAHPSVSLHSHNNVLEIIYVAKGWIVYETGGKSHRVQGGEIFLNFPHETHGGEQLHQERVAHYWIGINMDGSGTGFLGYRHSETVPFFDALRNMQERQFKGDPALRKLFDKFIGTMTSRLPYRKILATAVLTEILSIVLECSRQAKDTGPSLPIRRCMELIETNLEKRILLKQLEDVAHLSLSRIKQRFRKEVGIPPYEYILTRKVERAKELLAKRNQSVTDIAFILGFPSSQHFATIFKKISGETPTEFVRPPLLT